MPQDKVRLAVEAGAKAAFKEFCRREGFPGVISYDDLYATAKADWRRLVVKAVNAASDVMGHFSDVHCECPLNDSPCCTCGKHECPVPSRLAIRHELERYEETNK